MPSLVLLLILNIMTNTLKQLRKEKGYSMEEVSRMIKVSRVTLSKWENGRSKPRVDRAIEIADLLKVDVKDIKW